MGFFLHACMCTACMQYPLRPEEAGRPLGTGASAGWAPPGNPTWALCKVASAFKHRAISPVLGTYFPPLYPPPHQFSPDLWIYMCEFFNLSVPQFFYLESCRKVLQSWFWTGSAFCSSLETEGRSAMLRTALEVCTCWRLIKAVLSACSLEHQASKGTLGLKFAESHKTLIFVLRVYIVCWRRRK